MIEPGRWMTVEQTLKVLPLGKTLLYDLVNEGQIPAIRVCKAGSRRGRLLIDREGLAAYVARLRQPAAARTVKVDVDSLREKVRNGIPAAPANLLDEAEDRR